MNRRDLFTLFIVLFLFTSVIPSFSQPTTTEIKANQETMYVIVNSTIYDSIEPELTMYKEDVQQYKNLTVKLHENNHSTPEQLRNFLKDKYNNESMVGTFFVGNLPYAQYEIPNDFEGYCRFPIDHFYTDLNGTWNDSDSNGIYDEHSGHVAPEIWFGRLCMKTNWTNETDLYRNYFHKLHDYRTGNLSLPHRSLLYVDDDWVNWTEGYRTSLEYLYNDPTVINNKTTTNATDYRKRIQEGYEWIQIHCHANHSAKRHAFKMNDGPKGSGGNFTSEELFNNSQRSLFQNIFTCGSANYTVENYLCGWYALTENYGLANVGTTKPGSMLNFQAYYQPLANGKTMGEALKQWWIDTAEDSRSWFYGVTTIGDPTLSPTYKAPSDKKLHLPFRITNNTDFHQTANEENWTGNGTESNPYIIKKYDIYGTGHGYCIFIEDTDVHFVIKNNYLHNASHDYEPGESYNSAITLHNVKNGRIQSNNISHNQRYGIHLKDSINVNITDNVMYGNGIHIEGSQKRCWNTHDIPTSNTVNGKPVYYFKNTTEQTVPHPAGQIILANCSFMDVLDHELTRSSVGVSLGYCDHTKVTNVTSANNTYGIYLMRSDTIKITKSTFKDNSELGIFLEKSRLNNVSKNHIHSNQGSGVFLFYNSNENILWNNEITQNTNYGIDMSTSYNLIKNNFISNNSDGMYVVSTSNLIEGNTITHNSDIGIKIRDADENTISDNLLSHNPDYNIFLTTNSQDNDIENNVLSDSSTGINIAYSDSNNIENNNVSNHDYAISLDSSSHNTIISNTASWNFYSGITLSSSDQNTITSNTVEYNNRNGISISESSKNDISSNNISENNWYGIQLKAASDQNVIDDNTLTSNGYDGISIYSSNRNIIESNVITNSTYNGIYLSSSSNNTIRSNILKRNDWYGVQLDISYENVVYHNDFLNNSVQAYDNTDNYWYNTTLQEGNYWSDYEGTDEDGDGIGETPYDKISGGDSEEDEYPLVKSSQHAPSVTITHPSLNQYFNRSDVTVSWTGNNAERYEIRLSGTVYNNVETSTEHTFEDLDDGSHTVTVKAVNGTLNSTDEVNFYVDTTPPTSRIEANETYVEPGHVIEFHGGNSTDNLDIADYYWDFGDGTSTMGAIEYHSYSSLGEHTVTLTTTDQAGNSNSTSIVINVQQEVDNIPPTATIDAEQTTTTGQEVTFDASHSTDNEQIETYTWTINGEQFQGKQVTYRFEEEGTYEVDLTVEDASGNTDTTTFTVTVEESSNWIWYLIPMIILVPIVILALLYYKFEVQQEERQF